MSGTLHKAGRLAAGHGCFVVFHVLRSGVIHPIRLMTDVRGPTPDMSRGMSDKERALIVGMVEDLDRIAETFRKLAWRFARVKHDT